MSQSYQQKVKILLKQANKMIAFSHVPPLRQQNHQTLSFQFPLEQVITIDAINQTNQKRKPHIINNPNLIVSIKKETIDIQKENVVHIDSKDKVSMVAQVNDNEKEMTQINKSEENITKNEEKIKSNNELQPQSSLQVKDQQLLKTILNERSPIMNLEQSNDNSENLPIQSLQKNQIQPEINNQQFKQLSHIIFSQPQQSSSFNWHTKTIFNKIQSNNQLPQSNFIQSAVKENQEKIHQSIVHNFQCIAQENQQIPESHIECTLFGNSKYKQQSHDLYRTRHEFQSVNHKNQQKPPILISQQSNLFIEKNERQTSDQDLYDSYYQNRNRIKPLGGKKSSQPKKKCKLNLKPIKIQITKTVNISPHIF